MIIKNMFTKPIDRDIKGVIKVGQDDDANIRQELEEYVVTRELQKHFAEFFSSYKRGINDYTDKMGVWISGFFGSGKSHFLKILSYLLANKEVDGKTALEYFIEDNKIKDPMVLGDMRLAAQVPTDVILFNIDSKGEMNGKQSKDAIVSVFLKVFNEMQGFCGAIPALADLERKLTEDGKYQQFKDRYTELFDGEWIEDRNDFDFIQDDVVEVLSDIGFMSEESARNWCEKTAEPYAISIERFAELVQKYIAKKGDDHHIIFLVDEIGQYISDDSSLMLNLQTVTEDLGTVCKGKAWIIVTSQQDIDSITKTKGNDFSKIQGRFDTRLSLSSADVEEVIRKRILEKNAAAKEELGLLYEEKSTVIKNLILFNDNVEKKLYSGEENFSAVYPFIPYQFNLLGDVLTSIRIHGASGKHLAEGERSMLALFKESAMRLMGENPGSLAPFHMFYDALEQFLDHSHKGVIAKALDNECLNPDHAEECFDVNVLKTLFMIKYVNKITANLNNVTSLMVSNIDDDRIALTKRVEEALNRLIQQALVQKNGEIYIFLTNEEQEIEREIEKQTIEMAEVISKVSEMIFDDIYAERKYRYPAHNNRYAFSFNQVVDDRPYKANQNHDITLQILTPNSDEMTDDVFTLRALSSQNNCVLMVLPNDHAFLDEITSSLKIEKFLRSDTVNPIIKSDLIRESKNSEKRERMAAAKLYLEDSLKEAAIFVNGDTFQTNAKDINSRINDALGKLVSGVYHKLSYIDMPMGEAELRKLFREEEPVLELNGEKSSCNSLALNDVYDFIKINSDRHVKTSMKSILDRFKKAPYGFIEDDINWLVGRLFKDGDISFAVNNEPVTIYTKSKEEIIRYITRKEFNEKLMTEKRKSVGDKQKKSVRTIMKELFHVSPAKDDEDAIRIDFQRYSESLRNELNQLNVYYENQSAYPGKKIISKGKQILGDVISLKYTAEFFNNVCDHEDDFLDFSEDYEPIKAFFAGEQKNIFDKSLYLMEIYNDSKTFIFNERLEDVTAKIDSILQMTAPYRQIFRLKDLNEDFMSLYSEVLSEEMPAVKEAIETARSRVFEELKDKHCHDKLSPEFVKKFEAIREKAESCNNVAALHNIRQEADTLKIRLLNDIAEEEQKIILELKHKAADPEPVIKKQRTISIRKVNISATWQLETEADVEKYISELERKLKNLLEEDTVINIEF